MLRRRTNIPCVIWKTRSSAVVMHDGVTPARREPSRIVGKRSTPALLPAAQSIESTPSLLRGTRPEVGPKRASEPPVVRRLLASGQ
jgi:hypothetical protein